MKKIMDLNKVIHMKKEDISYFNEILVNAIYKEIEELVRNIDSDNITEMLILQHKLNNLLLILREENQMTAKKLLEQEEQEKDSLF